MKNKFWLSATVLFLFPLAVFCQTKWKTTSSEVVFKIKNAGFTVTGRFGGFNGQLAFSPDKLQSSSLKGSVQVGTIKTGIDKRDADLKEEKYFNEGKYKTISIKSTKLYKKGNQYAGLFNVTIKGVTKQMEIPFTFTQHGKEAEFKGSLTISRKQFGIGGPTLTMSDEANVSIVVKATE